MRVEESQRRRPRLENPPLPPPFHHHMLYNSRAERMPAEAHLRAVAVMRTLWHSDPADSKSIPTTLGLARRQAMGYDLPTVLPAAQTAVNLDHLVTPLLSLPSRLSSAGGGSGGGGTQGTIDGKPPVGAKRSRSHMAGDVTHDHVGGESPSRPSVSGGAGTRAPPNTPVAGAAAAANADSEPRPMDDVLAALMGGRGGGGGPSITGNGAGRGPAKATRYTSSGSVGSLGGGGAGGSSGVMFTIGPSAAAPPSASVDGLRGGFTMDDPLLELDLWGPFPGLRGNRSNTAQQPLNLLAATAAVAPTPRSTYDTAFPWSAHLPWSGSALPTGRWDGAPQLDAILRYLSGYTPTAKTSPTAAAPYGEGACSGHGGCRAVAFSPFPAGGGSATAGRPWTDGERFGECARRWGRRGQHDGWDERNHLQRAWCMAAS